MDDDKPTLEDIDEEVYATDDKPRPFSRRPATTTKIKVKIAWMTPVDGNYIVYNVENIAEVRLMPVSSLAFSSKPQEVSLSEFQKAQLPYMWDDEISELVYSRDQIRLAILGSGLAHKPEKVDLKELVAKLLSKGVLPIS